MGKKLKKEELLKKEDERHQKYLDLLSSYTDEEIENMSYWDLVSNGIIQSSGTTC